MYDLATIRKMNNEHTPAEELGKAQTGAEIKAAACQERADDAAAMDAARESQNWSEPRNEH